MTDPKCPICGGIVKASLDHPTASRLLRAFVNESSAPVEAEFTFTCTECELEVAKKTLSSFRLEMGDILVAPFGTFALDW